MSVWRTGVFLVALAIIAAVPGEGLAAQVPAQFGSDHDDPRTAYPPVPRPSTAACRVLVIDHAFASFDPAVGHIDAAAACPGPWHKVVMELDGEVAGRQYDRIGHLAIGGVTVFRTSSPEPSREGIAWHVEKDLSAYAPLLRQPQAVEMHLGNLVNETYTGVFKVKVRLAFYRADGTHAAAATADSVAPLDALREDGADTVGRFVLPANAERLLAEVYATGSGGGCEEFWYFNAPVAGYSCHAEQGPYREVQVLVDGRVAGIAAPYPHIYTGGWSNPFLWYAIPAPRAFDIHPLRFDLTPFVGLLNDGQAHELRLRVLGVASEGKGWSLHPNLQVWRDHGSATTRGELLEATVTPLALANPVTTSDDGGTRLATRGEHAFLARGVLHTSRGRVETRVERRLHSDIEHRWDAREEHDRLRAQWHDTQTVTRRHGRKAPRTEQQALRFGLDGSIQVVQVAGKPRLTTTLDIHDEAEHRQRRGRREVGWSQTRDRFQGSAAYTSGVPREQRNAVGHSRQTWSQRGADGCQQRTIEQRNGVFAADVSGCAPARDGGDAALADDATGGHSMPPAPSSQ